MAHMQQQITSKQRWLAVETSNGTEYIYCAYLGLFIPDSAGDDNEVQDAWFATVQQYCEGEPESWTNVQGYGARLSAPGYLDCTAWTVFDTAEEAQAYLDEEYSEDEEE